MSEREVYVLMEDVDGTMWSGPEPIGFAVTSEREAKAFVRDDPERACRKLRVFDTADEVEVARKREYDKRNAEYKRRDADRRVQERRETRVAFKANKNRVVPAPEFSDEEKELLGNGDVERLVLKAAEFEGAELEGLEAGDVLRGKLSGLSYVVTGNYGGRLTAVRTVDITNSDEWLLVKKR